MNTSADKTQFLIGLPRAFLYLRISLHLGFMYLTRWTKGEITFVDYLVICKRLLTFLAILRFNKVAKIGDSYKLQLYVPAYPTPAFFRALEKFEPARIPGPLTVVFSMTKACAYKCPHCYQRNDSGPELDESIMLRTAKAMQRAGTVYFNIEGGEPMLRFDRLIKLCEHLGPEAEIWVNTTGHMLDEERVKRMKKAGVYGVMVSLHSADEAEFEAFTGMPGSFKFALNAMRMFRAEGLGVTVNTVPSIEIVRSGKLEKILQIARDNGAHMVQIIHTKPSGAWLNSPEVIITQQELIDRLKKVHKDFNNQSSYSDYPSISAQVFEEDRTEFGCTAGMIDRYYLGHTGELQPCEFINVSFGNVAEEPFETIAARMREQFKTPGCNWLCCTEAASIANAITKYDVKSTPLPKEITAKIIGKWNKGEPTPLYKRLGIYR